MEQYKFNLSSDSIKIFPAANRSFKYDTQSRLMSEVNITNMVKILSPAHNYVVSKTLDLDGTIKFVLNGYYIEASVSDLLDDKNGLTLPIYANICVKDFDKNDISVLQGNDSGDSDSKYFGVTFTSTEALVVDDQNIKVYSLKLLDEFGINKDPIIPESSLYKYDAFDFSLNVIDCGNWNDPVDNEAIDKIYEKFGVSDWKLA